jgi:dolichol-phosphate mannosyltransferase
LLGTWYVVSKIAGWPYNPGLPTIVLVVSFFSGMQLLSLGLMGEYVGRIYDEVKRRPKYIVDYTVELPAKIPPQSDDAPETLRQKDLPRPHAEGS